MNFHGIVWKYFMKICSVIPLQNKIVFSSFDGQAYSDNPREIYEYMRSAYKDKVKFVWIMNEETDIDGAKVVRNYSFASVYHLATAKVWIDNSRKRSWMIKRKKQFYVQTWHGDVCIKRIEADAETLNDEYVADAKHDSEMADILVSGSSWRSKNFSNAFWYSGKILELGTPKADIYYKHKDNQVAAVVKTKYNINKDEQILLYLPTFRNDKGISWFDLDFEKVIESLNSSWGGAWKALVKLHPNMLGALEGYNFPDQMINVSDYHNTAELIRSSDLIITDYSGCMFEGLEADKKVILYTPDFDSYMDERGVYWDFKELPFPMSYDNNGLIRSICEFNNEEYYKKSKQLKEKIGYFNSDHSTELVSKYIYNSVWRGV